MSDPRRATSDSGTEQPSEKALEVGLGSLASDCTVDWALQAQPGQRVCGIGLGVNPLVPNPRPADQPLHGRELGNLVDVLRLARPTDECGARTFIVDEPDDVQVDEGGRGVEERRKDGECLRGQNLLSTVVPPLNNLWRKVLRRSCAASKSRTLC